MHMRRTLSVIGAAITAAALISSAPAFAQDKGTSSSSGTNAGSNFTVGSMEGAGGLYDKSVHTRTPSITVWAFLPYTFAIGVGGRFTLPVVADGFIPDINDSFEIEIGADLVFGSYPLVNAGYIDLSLVPVEGRWTFHFTPNLSAYAKLGLGYTLEFSSYTGAAAYGSRFYYNFAIGGMYNLTDKFGIRLEAGYQGLKVGVVLGF